MVSLRFGSSFQRLTARFFSLLFLGFLLSPRESHATALLYRVTENDILVGADSFLETDGIEQPPKAVKIHQAGREFFAIQGKSRVGETKLIDLVGKAISGPEKRIDTSQFAQRYQQALTQWLKGTSAIRPDLYQPYAKNGVTVTAFQLFGFKQGKPFMETLEFVTDNLGTSILIRRQQMSFDKETPVWIPAGIWTQGNPTKDFIITNDPVSRMRYLFDREFRAALPAGQARLVRPPLDILRISALGAKWIQKKPECPEIKPYGSADSVALSPGR